MPPNERDEIILGFTEKEVKFLLMSLKCIETHGNRRFLNCAHLAQLTGYSCAEAYKYYMDDLLQKIIALPPINLACDSDDQKHADTAGAAVEKDGKTDSGAGKDEDVEKEKTEKDVYKGIGDGVDGAGGDPEDEQELQALGSAYAWDC